jgi:multidrug resistance efflux pump
MVMAKSDDGPRKLREITSGLVDRVREPGWPRTMVAIGGALLFLLIPYPINVSGDFEVITLEPAQVHTLTDGIIDQVLVHAGERVEKGAVVARLLDTYLQIDKAKLDAQLKEKKAQLLLAQRGYRQEEIEKARLKQQELQAMVSLARGQAQRNAELHKAGILSVEELERTRTDYIQKNKELAQAEQELKQRVRGLREEEIDQAKAEVEQLQAQVAELDQHLAWTEVVASGSGLVITPEHELRSLVGQHVAKGSAILKIVDPERLVARIQVPESEFGDVAVGQKVSLRAYQLPSDVISGVVDSIEPTVERLNEFATTVPVLSKLEDARGRLRPGTTGKAKIDCGPKFIGYIIYRRFLRSIFVQIWSWY